MLLESHGATLRVLAASTAVVLLVWKLLRRRDDEKTVLRIRRRDSVPPVPDVSMISETVNLERGYIESIRVRAGVDVDASRVLREHGSFREYRRRLIWQVLKRRWFAALTEETASAFETRASFLDFVIEAHSQIFQSLRNDCIVGPYIARNAVRLLFKGGNVVNMVKGACVRLLQAGGGNLAVSKLAEMLAPAAFSDIDFYLLVDYLEDPDLADPRCFQIVHLAARDCAKEGLRKLVLPEQWGAKKKHDRNGERLGAVLSRAVSELVDDLGVCHNTLRDEDHRLSQLRHEGCLQCKPALRRDVTIRQRQGREEEEVELTFAGESRRAYVSDNALIEHRDARCITEEDVCRFSLTRLLCGFKITATTKGAKRALDIIRGEEGEVLCKGEGVDVSIPHRNDVNLALWCQSDRDEPGSFARIADLQKSDGSAYSLLCESLDALILEQRDLTFGKRAHNLLIWRVAKADKRLKRLVELLGINLFAAETADWTLKFRALSLLFYRLDHFAERTFATDDDADRKKTRRRLTLGPIDNRNDDARRSAKKKKTRNSTGKARESEGASNFDIRALPESTVAAARSAGLLRHCDLQSCLQLLDKSLVSTALLLPLDHLALRVFAADDEGEPNAQTSFTDNWKVILEPLVHLVELFRDAAQALATLPAGQQPLTIDEADLYYWPSRC